MIIDKLLEKYGHFTNASSFIDENNVHYVVNNFVFNGHSLLVEFKARNMTTGKEYVVNDAHNFTLCQCPADDEEQDSLFDVKAEETVVIDSSEIDEVEVVEEEPEVVTKTVKKSRKK